MALRFCDSFAHYPTADLANKWSSTSGGATIAAGIGRWGGQGLRIGDNDVLTKILVGGHTTWIVGMAVFIESHASSGGSSRFIQIMEGSTVHTTLVGSQSTGQWLLYRGDGLTLLDSGSFPSINKWYYLELVVTISDSVGIAQTYIDGVLDCNFSGDTQNGATGTAETIRLIQRSGSGGQYRASDLYVNDGSGSAPNNDRLGDIRVECLFPNGNGNASDMDGSDGNQVDNYLLVDETTSSDADTTYVQSNVVNEKETYAYTNPTPVVGDVYGVQTVPYMRKTDAGARSFRNLARLSGTEIDNGADITMSTTYDYAESIFETKPGGGAWSLTDVSNAEFGYKITV